MTEVELDKLVGETGTARARHVIESLRSMMPTLLYTNAGARTRSFIEAFEAAVERAEAKVDRS